MFKIFGCRASGKTYNTIIECSKRNCDILVGTERRAEQINQQIKQMGITNVTAVTVPALKGEKRSYMIDEIEQFLWKNFNIDIIGFSCNIDANDVVLESNNR